MKRRKEHILGYVPKYYSEKKNSGTKGLTEALLCEFSQLWFFSHCLFCISVQYRGACMAAPPFRRRCPTSRRWAGWWGGLWAIISTKTTLTARRYGTASLAAVSVRWTLIYFLEQISEMRKNFNYSKRIKNIRSFYFNQIFIFAKIIF